MSDRGDAARIVAGAYDAVGRGDIAGLFALIASDAVWHVPGGSPLAGSHRGHDAIRGFLGALRERSSGTMRVQLDELTVGERSVVALQRVTATREERSLDVSMCVVYRVSNGLLVDARYYVDELAQYDAFWS